MKIKGNEVYWLSSKGNVAVVYTQFAMDVKYKVYRKVKYGGNHLWDYVIVFATYGEALGYAKKIHDEEVER